MKSTLILALGRLRCFGCSIYGCRWSSVAPELSGHLVVTPIAPLNQQAGYFCSVCECVVKDSANYLDHINGKKHQRALGMSMRVERASLEQVQQRFENLKKRKDPGTFTEQDLDDRILKQQQEEEERKRQKRERKKEKKKEKAVEEEIEVDPDVAAMMGFGGFGTSKK